MKSDMPKKTVVITDLDNTLYDWVYFWYESFNAMLSKIEEISGIKRALLIPDIKKVHASHSTSEYSFLIQEMKILQEKYRDQDLSVIFQPAIDLYRKKRDESLKLFDGVLETLIELKRKGSLIVGFTESQEFYSTYRIKRLGLDGLLDIVYFPPELSPPSEEVILKARTGEPSKYSFARTQKAYTPICQTKPNPSLLLSIVSDIKADISEVVYIGDSLTKDIAMAKMVGVSDVFAQYGVAHSRPEYQLLRDVTHWKEDAVKKEKETNVSHTNPTYTLAKSFNEILSLFSFEPFISRKMVDSHIQNIVEAWKKTVDVQMHFNDLELRIRNFAITLLGAILGVAALTLKDNPSFIIYSLNIPVASVVAFIAFVCWNAFYFMDRFWYHRLLRGAVKQGLLFEKQICVAIPNFKLTKSIGDSSPFSVGKITIHTNTKMDAFYGAISIALLTLCALLFFNHSKPELVKNPVEVIAKDTTFIISGRAFQAYYCPKNQVCDSLSSQIAILKDRLAKSIDSVPPASRNAPQKPKEKLTSMPRHN
jgi:phosphoglycolate phosphatase-like HAD superfamily hydrolase